MVGCFTGMRKTEILTLGQNCLQQKIIEDREVYVLNGYTSKTSSTGVRKATWITSKTIFPIIDTLKGLHSIIKNICDHYGLYQNIAIHEYPLFPHIPIQKKLVLFPVQKAFLLVRISLNLWGYPEKSNRQYNF